jgi:beta-aspartyl-dipeptidase (metallo-type)
VITIIDGVEIFAPEPLGRGTILIVGGKIAGFGPLKRADWENLGVEVCHIDGTGLVAIPGLIDPHEHLIGGSGESGFASQTPEISVQEIVRGGITTVVGCLGVDTTTKTMPALLAKAKGLREHHIHALLWTGGYPVPPSTLTDSAVSDILYIEEIIGAGEVAIADHRSSQPSAAELARLVKDVSNGGLLAGKAGVTHFHVGADPSGLCLLRELIDSFEVDPRCLYPTHLERTEALMLEAIDLSRRGVTIDIDTCEEDLDRWLRFYLAHGGDIHDLTVSTDAAINSPETLFPQLMNCVQQGMKLEQVLPCVTSNTARVLKLERKGRLKAGMDADVVLFRAADHAITDVIASGRRLLANGTLAVHEKFLDSSNRRMHFHGHN